MKGGCSFVFGREGVGVGGGKLGGGGGGGGWVGIGG